MKFLNRKYFPINRDDWENCAESYWHFWRTPFRSWLSSRELSIIRSAFSSSKLDPSSVNVLDIGVGAGRIVSFLTNDLEIINLSGIDFSQNMVDFVSKNYGKKINVKCFDIASIEPIPFTEKFDFVTSVRVLKYCSNLEHAFFNISKSMSSGGYFVFSIPNKHSITYLSSKNRLLHTLSKNDVSMMVENYDFELIKAAGFNRLPEVLYDIDWLNYMVCKIENFISVLLRNHLFSREVFYVVKKK